MNGLSVMVFSPYTAGRPTLRWLDADMMGWGGHVIETVLRSEDLPVADRFAWWREMTSQTLTPTEITSDHADDFRACFRLLDLGAAQVSVLSYPSLRSRRTSALVRRSDRWLFSARLFRPLWERCSTQGMTSRWRRRRSGACR